MLGQKPDVSEQKRYKQDKTVWQTAEQENNTRTPQDDNRSQRGQKQDKNNNGKTAMGQKDNRTKTKTRQS